jgi:dTDP-4-amino-4,6-dideoxygalactose transaminase
MTEIPFNRPFLTGRETRYIEQAVEAAHLSAGGGFTRRCRDLLVERLGTSECLLLHSATAALEMSALLLDCGPGDEVVMPSFTFVTTANAFVMRGAIPVFVDVRSDTLNLDETRLEAAITARTKAIVPVHYAGVGCDMAAIGDIARGHGVAIVEDAAQGILSEYRGRALGTLGQLGALSFHETKNVTCGEGGGLLVNDPAFVERAEILREKGTNRSRFFRGEVDKYTWVDLGSSHAMSELAAAFLWAQLEHVDDITRARLRIWDAYHRAFEELELRELVRRPVVPDGCVHNAHLYQVRLPNLAVRSAAISALAERGVNAVFHYVPLHASPAGQRHGRVVGPMDVTEEAGDCLLRLPLWAGMEPRMVERVIAAVHEVVPMVAAAGART